MKISQAEPPRTFAPITITLETLEEARIMRARLNMNWDSVKRGGSSKAPSKDPDEFGNWQAINNIVREYD